MNSLDDWSICFVAGFCSVIYLLFDRFAKIFDNFDFNSGFNRSKLLRESRQILSCQSLKASRQYGKWNEWSTASGCLRPRQRPCSSVSRAGDASIYSVSGLGCFALYSALCLFPGVLRFSLGWALSLGREERLSLGLLDLS